MTTTILSHGSVTWTNIIDPSQVDIDVLAARYPHFHTLNLQDCLSELEFPKLDHHDDYVFLVVQFPFWDPTEKISRPSEIDIFVSNGTLVTVHKAELKPLVDLYANVQADGTARAEWMEAGASPLLYKILNLLVDYCFPIVHKVHHNLKQIEDSLFRKDTRHVLNQIAMLRRDIISLKSIIKPQADVIEALIRGNWSFIHEDLDPYWGDIQDHIVQLSALLDVYSEVVSGLSDTVDALASHRIDEVVRILTIVTVLTLPVTVLSTVFSMNIVLPFARYPHLFYTLMGAGIGIALLTIWYLRKKNWF